MKLSIEHKGNYQYAKIPGKSIRIDGKVRKTGVVYLGRVIDLDKGVFCNKERGVYTYDVKTGKYGTADPGRTNHPRECFGYYLTFSTDDQAESRLHE